MSIIITIDGPVGSGKSTAAKLLARRKGYACLDTGAMYRAIGWKAHITKIDLNEENLESLCANTRLELKLSDGEQRVFIDEKDIAGEIRTPDVSAMASAVSRFASVRRHLVRIQREIGLKWAEDYGGVVVEGRDIGTVVFPDATVKFFLEADIVERGRRRWKELTENGVGITLEETIDRVKKRDAADSERSIDPLRKADDAIVINTTGLAVDEVVEKILSYIKILNSKH